MRYSIDSIKRYFGAFLLIVLVLPLHGFAAPVQVDPTPRLRDYMAEYAAADESDTQVNTITNSILEVVLNGDIDEAEAVNTDNWFLTSPIFGREPRARGGISPQHVERFSTPLNIDDRDLNGQNEDDRVLQHRLYLYFEQPLQMNMVYTVLGSNLAFQEFVYPNNGGGNDGAYSETVVDDVSATITVGGKTGRSKAIKVNQAGYSAAATERYAYVGYWLPDGALELEQAGYTIYTDKGSEVATGITSEPALDEDSQEMVMDIDLSLLEAGDYYVEVNGIGRSHTFTIGDGAFHNVYTAARGLYHQRAGIALTEEYTDWTHEECHLTVYKIDLLDDWNRKFPGDLDPAVDAIDVIEVPGGWYDAGDYDRRAFHINIVDELVTAQEVVNEELAAVNFDIPESDNTLPDLIDEALYGLRVWELLQEENGGVRSGIEAAGHPGAGTCEDDDMDYWTYNVNQGTSYRFAAAAANMARVLEDYDQDVRDPQELIDEAERAFAWAEEAVDWDSENPAYGYDGYKSVARNRFAAAGSLFAVTGNEAYQDVYAELLDEHLNPTHYDTMYSLWPMAVSEQSNTDADIQTAVRNKIINSANQQFIGQYMEDDPYRNSFRHGDPIDSGTATNTTRYTMPIIMAYHLDPENAQTYIDAVSLNVDYQLGANANGMSWVTGLGIRNPEYPLQLNSMYDAVESTVPGLPVYGPNPDAYTVGECPYAHYANWKCLAYEGFYPEFNDVPDMYQYGPWANMPLWNEFTVWQDMGRSTAALAFQYATSGEAPELPEEPEEEPVDNPEDTPEDNPEETPTDDESTKDEDTSDGDSNNDSIVEAPQEDREEEESTVPSDTTSTDDPVGDASGSTNSERTMESVLPTTRGFQMLYTDDTSKTVNVFKKGKRNTSVLWDEQSDLGIVLHANGKLLRLVNAEGTVLETKRLSKKKKYGAHGMQVARIRNKKHIVITSYAKKAKQSRIATVRYKVKKERFGKKSVETLRVKAKVHKTAAKKRKLIIRSTTGKHTVRFNRRMQLRIQK